MLDYEGELVVVVGRGGRDIPKSHALDHVFGYTILNDISARDLARERGQWFKGKSLDTFAPLGPWIVHRSRIADPYGLVLRTRVNGEIRQESSTSDMIFSISALIEDVSQGMTLEAGDLIATGTPAGTGSSFNPQRWLQAGDVVEVEVEGVGTLRNSVTDP
jgi:2-keto-4-pentenoate hydratase/2-oxohepta-3-ene-1,7-dioic acid hydratase in catechol pathway